VGLSFFAGTLLKPILSEGLTDALAFTVLFVIGVVKLLDSLTKSLIRRHSNLNKQLNGSIFNLKFVLHLYASPTDADTDASHSISPAEAVLLAVSLSLDGLAVGFGAAMAGVNGLVVVAWSLATNVLFLGAGHLLGRTLTKKTALNLSWLGGAALIALAFSRLI